MADWKQITARIRRARTGKDPAGQLTNLFTKTRDAMVAFELARYLESIGNSADAGRWYLTAAERFRRADWKTKAQESATRLGATAPAEIPADLTPPASTPAEAEALSEAAAPAEPSPEESASPLEPSAEPDTVSTSCFDRCSRDRSLRPPAWSWSPRWPRSSTRRKTGRPFVLPQGVATRPASGSTLRARRYFSGTLRFLRAPSIAWPNYPPLRPLCGDDPAIPVSPRVSPNWK